jgi:hypothetical protein
MTEAIPTNLSYFKIWELIIKCKKENLNKLHLFYGKVVKVFDKKKINNTKTFAYKVSYIFDISRTTIRNFITSGNYIKIITILNFLTKYKLKILKVKVVERSWKIKSIICLLK